METPFFSIIIPVYNKEKYIQKTLSTILSQDFTLYEIVIVDDGSVDNSATIINKINDIRIRYFYQKNQGVSAARNKGITEANGNWIIFLDADDELEKDCLSTFYNLILKYPSYHIYLGNFRMIYSSFTRIVCKYNKETIITEPYKAVWYEWAKMRPGNAAIDANIIKNKIFFNNNLTLFEDFEFERQILSLYSVVYTPKIVMNYRGEYGSLNHGVCPITKVWGLDFNTYSKENLYFKLQAYKVFLSILRIRKSQKDNNGYVIIKNIMDNNFGKNFIHIYNCAFFLKRIINYIYKYLQ